ncbi:MAG: radical SAM-associated putative lipoprotein [Bacteroidales bacterium]|jgi:putative lipoprotein (rSAM/lipoprotein system)|nr:radical SAM-associated putative lipoprotein [Bacteroidales bacterium]
MKRQILKISNAILASILALFGVSSCEQPDEYGPPYDDFRAEYGSPYSEYTEINGHVQNGASQPIQNIQVIHPKYKSGDTVYTDENGNFVLRTNGVYPMDTIKLYFNDIDGSANGSYQNDTADVPLIYSGRSGEWNMGVGRGTVTKTLKEKNK